MDTPGTPSLALDEADDAPALPTYEFHADRLPELEARVEKVNKRLARVGVQDRFTYTVEHFTVTDTDKTTNATVTYPRVLVVLSVPRISISGYTFIATLTREEAGMIVRVVPGQNLDGWTRPEEHDCDYCGKSRLRTRSYVVRNDETGALQQVGNSCLQPFLGIAPAGLWLLQYDYDDLAPDGDDERFFGGRVPVVYDVRKLLALAWVVSEEGRQFVTRNQAREWDKSSTADDTLAVWHHKPSSRTPEFNAYVATKRAEADAVDPAAVDAILAEADTLAPGTDYADNMHIAVAGQFITRASVGLLLSLIAVHYRNSGKRREAATRPAVVDEYLGSPKTSTAPATKLTGIDATALVVFEIEGFNYDTVDTIIVLQADTGHMLKWKASGTHDEIVQGSRYRIDRATVKNHAIYRDVKQTVITRAKLTPLDADQVQQAADDSPSTT